MRSTNALVARVEEAAAREGFTLDPAQQRLLQRLAALGDDLSRRALRKAAPRSLYIHGGAGRGKSWLADAFFSELTVARKTRVHFHGFFEELHRSIHRHRAEEHAVAHALDDIAGNSRLLFFDEFHVHDSGDARLLTRLLQHVFERGLTVLTTSNYAPDDLLPNPIWHHTFEPGIELIKAHMQVWNLDGPIDYRTVASGAGHGFASGVWTIAPPAPAPEAHRRIAVSRREFDVVSASGDELTATFDQLCVAPTSTIEFLQWSRRYRRWTITGIPAFSDADPEAQQRFINLVDVLVDSDVSVVFSSHVGLRRFLTDASQRPDAFRMSSRLQLLRTRPSPESQKDNGKRLPSLPSRYRVHAR